MNEPELRRLIQAVGEGRVARRDFIGTLLKLGIGAPIAGQLLLNAGVAQTPVPSPYRPTKRGGGGALRTLWWQGPTLLNPHFAPGNKDMDGSRLFYEPLASWDQEGNLIPLLAAEIPTPENGGVARDGRSVTWKLKKDVLWHDGKPFTSADVVFNWQYASDPATAAVTIGSYSDMKVIAVDAHTVRIEFARPRAFWAEPFVGVQGMIIPKHVFEAYAGDKSREAPANLKPVGTGPYKFVSFTPGDMVRGVINPSYHQPNRPYFDSVEMKGGGDAVSAARAVLQTGEYDYAWNLQVEDEILLRLERGAKGRLIFVPGGSAEYLWVNFSDPWTEVEGERSHPKSRHPILTDPAVRSALNLLIDRASIQRFIYGRAGVATPNFINNPERYRSQANASEFNVEKAAQLLEQAGWKKGADGIRAKDGRKLKLLFQTSVNQPRQKAQAIFKQACQKAGIELELKAVVASVFFSSDVGNPDTVQKFLADLQMFTVFTSPDPSDALLYLCSWEAAAKANKWQGRNIARWSDATFDETYRAAEMELDPVKRTALLIKLNDLAVQNHAVFPIVSRPMVNACSSALRPTLSGWDSDFAFLADWHRSG